MTPTPDTDRALSISYTPGLRDLAAMPHVSLDVGSVLRDCADVIDKLNTRIASTRPADRALSDNIERMGEALFSLSDRLRATDFIHSDSDPIKDANAAAYERVVLAWSKLTSALSQPAPRADDALLADIAEMMGEFVDNWPQPKRVGTALKLIAKTMRAALDPPKHTYWGAGEPDCPADIKAGNGELHTLRCKVCGNEDARDTRCRAALASETPTTAKGD